MESCSVVEETTQRLRLSARTIRSRYYKKNEDEPGKNRKRKTMEGVRDVDDFTCELIRRIIYRMFETGNVTLDTLLEAVWNSGDVGFRGGRTYWYWLLRNLGFSWRKTDPRRALLEDPHVSELRVDFLRRYKGLKEEGLLFVFLDETWFFSKGFPSKSWQDGSTYTCKRRSLDQGKRFVVLNAGCEQGFIKGAGILFTSGSNSGDYHGTMNGDMFEKWLQEQILPHLEEPSVIVMDNASYHSVKAEKLPTSKWTKAQLVSWLEETNIPHSRETSRSDLYQLTRQHRPPAQWRSYIAHTERLIAEDSARDLRLDNRFNVQPIVISVGDAFQETDEEDEPLAVQNSTILHDITCCFLLYLGLHHEQIYHHHHHFPRHCQVSSIISYRHHVLHPPFP